MKTINNYSYSRENKNDVTQEKRMSIIDTFF